MECGFVPEGIGVVLSCGWILLRSRDAAESVVVHTMLNPMALSALAKS
jgi:hypothetical protein